MSNRYLEKIASLREYKHMGLAALDIAKQSPMTTALGVGGGMEGALSTHRQRRENDTRLAMRAIKNTIVGAAKGAAGGKALELGYRHLKTKGAERGANQYLSKASSMLDAPVKLGRGVNKAWKETTGPTRLSLGIGASSLAIGAANFAQSQRNARQAEKKNDIEQKSLSALRGIHKAIVEQSE